MNSNSKYNSVVIISLNDKMGGAEQYLKMIAVYYLQKGYKVDVFFLTKSKGDLWEDLQNQLKLHYTEEIDEKKGLYNLFLNLKNNKKKYTLGFTSHIYLNSFAGLLRKLKILEVDFLVGRDSHSYYLVDSGFKKKLYQVLINVGYWGLDLLVSQTNEMKQQMIDNNRRLFKRIKIVTLPNPVSFSNITIDSSIVFKNKTVVAAGRLIKIKGFDKLIEAFARLEDESVHLIILGEGEERESLEKLCENLNLEKRVFLIGHKKDVFSYFKAATVCVVSSIKEGFPNVLLQMMSQNNNVISTLCAGGIDKINGLVVIEPDSVDDLCKALEYCLQKNDLLINPFKKELERRDIDSFIQKIDFYNEKNN